MLCNKHNISLDDVVVFGDDTNDIGLFNTCGYSVAMGNAIEDLKVISNEITRNNNDDGVAVVIERFLLLG